MINSAWNLDGEAASYKKYEKGWAGEDKKGGSSKPNPNGYGGFSKNATGKATMSSGLASADNNLPGSNQYYEGKNPKRKSLAASEAPGKNFNYANRSGKESTDFQFNHQEEKYADY